MLVKFQKSSLNLCKDSEWWMEVTDKCLYTVTSLYFLQEEEWKKERKEKKESTPSHLGTSVAAEPEDWHMKKNYLRLLKVESGTFNHIDMLCTVNTRFRGTMVDVKVGIFAEGKSLDEMNFHCWCGISLYRTKYSDFIAYSGPKAANVHSGVKMKHIFSR